MSVRSLLSPRLAVTLVLAGCDEARLGALPGARTPKASGKPAPGSSQLVQLLDTDQVPGAPMAGFNGLQARIQQATASGATLSVGILDRKTHELVSNGNSPIVGTASVAKLFIADDLLLQEARGKIRLSPDDRRALDIMLQSSDDGAADRFWDQGGGSGIISQVASRYGLPSTTLPSDGRW